MLNFISSLSSESKPSLILHCKTWSRDSHGLFDYECSLTRNSSFNIRKDNKIVRRKNDIRLEEVNYKEDEEEELIGRIYHKNLKYFLSNPLIFKMSPNEKNITSLLNKIWYIIRNDENVVSSSTNNFIHNENENISLRIGDIIKMGRVKYIITETNISNVKRTLDSLNDSVFDLFPEFRNSSTNSNDKYLCKICLSNNEEKFNPLINICKCSGSMQYIHYDCLKLWMGTKLKIKANEKKTVVSYNIKGFNCEICKIPYPLKFMYDGVCFELIKYVRPVSSNYIVFESLNQLKQNNNYKSVHIITLNDNDKIVIGRSNENDVRINDISVSRCHCSLHYINKKIVIKDMKSKFGTLLLVQGEIELSSSKKMSLQVGRTYIESCFALGRESKTKDKVGVGKVYPLTNGYNTRRQYLKNYYFGKI